MAAGQRLDERVLAEGLAESRSIAQGLIRAGRVLVDDTPVDKPGTRIRSEASLRIKGGVRRFVSRGGDKLAGALDALGVDCTDRHCLDVGASTGGFTDCLLQRGARHVVALDVGTGQLHEKLRQDPRVFALERVNARHLEASQLPYPVELVTVDTSFISVTLLLPRLAEVAPAAELLVMVKPQFELRRDQVGKGGVVRDDGLREAAVDRVRMCAAGLGYEPLGQVDSAIHGPKGNREIFLWLRRSSSDACGETQTLG